MCAWFGGAPEGDNEVAIWSSRTEAGVWQSASVTIDEPGVPTWNPVLFENAGVLWLHYKAGYGCDRWSALFITSEDDGRTWSEPVLLPGGVLGPIKNKPVKLSDGRILHGSSIEAYRVWTTWMYLQEPESDRWSIHGPIAVPEKPHGIIQPTVWEVSPRHVRALMRSTQDIGFICASESFDGGRTWTQAAPTTLPNPNSGIDAVKLADGRLVLVYNHTVRTATDNGRGLIHAAVSEDDGETWSDSWLIEDGGREYSYPAVIQKSDGSVHVTYTWNRVGVRHLALGLEEIDALADGTLARPV
jgi:predicted neuraminidase